MAFERWFKISKYNVDWSAFVCPFDINISYPYIREQKKRFNSIEKWLRFLFFPPHISDVSSLLTIYRLDSVFLTI